MIKPHGHILLATIVATLTQYLQISKLEKTICMNVFSVDSVEKFENEVIKRLPCVGLDQWRESKYRNRIRAQFQLSPLVTNHLSSQGGAVVLFNPKLLHIAQDFIVRNLGPLFVSVHVSAERILSTFKNTTAVVKCSSNLVKQFSEVQERY